MTTPNNERREEIALEPCPFCGGKAHILTGMVAFNDVEITCVECSVTGGNEDGEGRTVAENRQAAIAAWNRRTPLPPRGEEPVAWRYRLDKRYPWTFTGDAIDADRLSRLGQLEPLYATPPAPTNLQKVQSAPASQALAEPVAWNGPSRIVCAKAEEAFKVWEANNGHPFVWKSENERQAHITSFSIGWIACEDVAHSAPAEAQARVDDETLQNAKELVEDYGGHIGDVVSKLLAALLSGSTPKPAGAEG